MAANKRLSKQILEMALEIGADVAGIASVDALKNSPSHMVYGKLDHYRGVGTREDSIVAPGAIAWPTGTQSAIVIAISHPEDKPELDWWQGGLKGGTPGNRELMRINTELCRWLENDKGIKTESLPYHIEFGGIFLKDAGVLAGLGCIGENNLFVSKLYGPRVRLRAVLLDIELPPTGPIEFDPCLNCAKPCLVACPQRAFRTQVYRREDYKIDGLPGRDGYFSRDLCSQQMKQDIYASGQSKLNPEQWDDQGPPVKYCRRCEFSCPIGKI